MDESATPAGSERPPEGAIQPGPVPAHAGQPPDLGDEITRRPDPAELCSRQEPRHHAGSVCGEPPNPDAPKQVPSTGKWSLILGMVAICSIGVGFFLFFLSVFLILSAMSRPSTGDRSVDTPLYTLPVYTLPVSVGLICLGSVLALPGMALGLASLAQRGRPNPAGVAGCLINGLILGVWLFLFAAHLVAGANRRGYPGSFGPPPRYNEVDFFR